MISLVVLLLTVSSALAAINCADLGATTHSLGCYIKHPSNGHAYLLVTSTNDWEDSLDIASRAIVLSRHGYFAKFETNEEKQWALDLLNLLDPAPETWIGATDFPLNNGSYVWVDGDSASNVIPMDQLDTGDVEGNRTNVVYLDPAANDTASVVFSTAVTKFALVEFQCPHGRAFSATDCSEYEDLCDVANIIDTCGPSASCSYAFEAPPFRQGPIYCRCNAGYVSSNIPPDGKNCVRRVYCSRQHNHCGVNSTCTEPVVVPGVPTCVCNAGYESTRGDGTHCVDRQKCSDMICGTFSNCTQATYDHLPTSDPRADWPRPGSLICRCLPGYFSPSENGRNCIAINRCTRTPKICGSHSICTQTGAGTYSCACEGGYDSPAGNGQDCIFNGPM